MNSVAVREKDETMRKWLLTMEMIEIEGGPPAVKYEKVVKFARLMKSGAGYDPTMVEYFACVRRMRELSARMLQAARRGEIALEQEGQLTELSNYLNRIVMYSRRTRS